ncbi:MAG: 23S rRNA (guanosine(2251)-2'-O)-methyltransferase RlmB [Planctomycetaceae bacterium]
MASLILKNPHSVLAALQQRPQDVIEVRVPRQPLSQGWSDAIELAMSNRVSVQRGVMTSGGSGGRGSKAKGGGRESGAEAIVRERQPVELDELFASDSSKGLWLALDQVQDPHNVGAIFRAAGFFGVRGIVMTRHKSAPMTAVAYDVASGGVEHVPYTVVTNLRQAIDASKEAGLWVLGTSEHATQSIMQVDRDRKWLILLGNEESGLRRLTTEHCDELCSIPSLGGVDSLNVSVAAGVTVALMSLPG